MGFYVCVESANDNLCYDVCLWVFEKSMYVVEWKIFHSQTEFLRFFGQLFDQFSLYSGFVFSFHVLVCKYVA